MEYVTGSPPSSKSTPTDSFDATAFFTTMLCQAASMPSSASTTAGPSLQQMLTTNQHIPSSVASSSGHADQQLPTTSTTCNTDNLSQQTEQQVSTTDQSISVPITTVADIHIFPKKVSATPGPNSSNSSQISNALQHGTTAAQNMPISVTRPRIRTLPPIDQHDIITSASDIVSTPAEPANVYNCYPGPIHQIKSNTDIEIDFLELRIHPDTVSKVSSNSLTDSQFIFNFAKELFTPAEMFGRNYTGQKGKQSLTKKEACH
ncbi:unnamed protein product [Mytilus edulis]|uniref:Uncharacterized protein n=1 Tax=Mytilus edulis TaxID=6550 RepID=A0A8S3SPA0_MYTED|nr:unnamed protein product [Mytilus edulis]